ncbi:MULTISPECIES: IS66 family insertion sequence element accessory protein TnpA [Pseudoalteromonas]|uniref:IS66 family insertion sequence element accessory protein TnpA n=1 Tax=Pseudoalteromonas TaxID=53246 RepID=UPI0004ADBA67|nr:hypothetical protein [Pseudoalteromonas sp. SCSIO_11900]
MQKRTLNDWQKLIEQQQTSGLSIVAFCKENMLPTSNFYKYRSKLQDAAKAPKLLKVNSNCQCYPVPCLFFVIKAEIS